MEPVLRGSDPLGTVGRAVTCARLAWLQMSGPCHEGCNCKGAKEGARECLGRRKGRASPGQGILLWAEVQDRQVGELRQCLEGDCRNYDGGGSSKGSCLSGSLSGCCFPETSRTHL